MQHSTRHRAVPSSLLRTLGRKTRGTIRIIGIVAAALCVASVVAIFAFSSTNTVRFVPVMSNSMAPNMPVGSLALTSPVARADIKVGDVIVFIDPDHPTILVIHRIVHIYGPDEAAKFTNYNPNVLTASTKGDNNPSVDPWTLTVADATIWRLNRAIPEVGQPAIWFDNPVVRVWGFSAAGIALIIWMLVVIWRRAAPVAVPELEHERERA